MALARELERFSSAAVAWADWMKLAAAVNVAIASLPLLAFRFSVLPGLSRRLRFR
jgi:hypothetical protein